MSNEKYKLLRIKTVARSAFWSDYLQHLFKSIDVSGVQTINPTCISAVDFRAFQFAGNFEIIRNHGELTVSKFEEI